MNWYKLTEQDLNTSYPELIRASGTGVDPETQLRDVCVYVQVGDVFYTRPGATDLNHNREYSPDQVELDLWASTFPDRETASETEFVEVLTSPV